jgi:hypothetical protein
MLATALDVFEALQAACQDSEDRSVEMFAVFAFAALAASNGRHDVLTAPSLPAAHTGPPSHTTDQAGLDEVADQLAGLAQASPHKRTRGYIPWRNPAALAAENFTGSVCGLDETAHTTAARNPVPQPRRSPAP